MLILENISYIHPNNDALFSAIGLKINQHEKAALTGNNGAGKSTLLKIIANELQPAGGQMHVEAHPYYIPQILGQYDHWTVAQALKIDHKLRALKEILDGNLSDRNYTVLNDDWTLEERCMEALQHWQLEGLDLQQHLGTLSGGQKTKVFMAGMSIHQPELILLDEPGNHLDAAGRQLLHRFIRSAKSTLLVVSHDRKLLNLVDSIYELSHHGIKVYGGNYDFYKEQKQVESAALDHEIQSNERALRKAREKERETAGRQQKLDSRGKGKQEKAGVARIMMNTLRNNAENSTAKLKSVHAEKIGVISQKLQELRSTLPGLDRMKLGFDDPVMHKGKVLFTAAALNVSFNNRALWEHNLDLQILSGERIALKGKNGSGKTTLIKLISGSMAVQTGTIYRAEHTSVYIDQDYSLIDDRLSVYGQAQHFNASALQEHEIKTRLSRFLFTKEDWNKSCKALSGGERMRLLLCCLNIRSKSPDMIILDEPTNNLDIQNMEILTTAINGYQGTLLVVSHDETFLEQIHIERSIGL